MVVGAAAVGGGILLDRGRRGRRRAIKFLGVVGDVHPMHEKVGVVVVRKGLG